jgi:16S rRNA (adenine1518-N6/adenine1519-N6)-dimethyltransferase
LKRYLEDRGLGMQKKFGQNFLVNRGARDKLVAALGPLEGASVWEIGPGLGAMTRPMLEAGARLTAFEIDRGFAAALRELLAGFGNFRLVEGDALKTWRQEAAKPRLLFGNLPYNIAAVLIGTFVEEGLGFERAVVTVQKEVADRMSAKPGSADYSAFTVLCAADYRVKPLVVLKPGSFYPQPRVDSAAVVMERRPSGASEYSVWFRPVVRAAFAARRKTLRNNLEHFLAGRGLPAELGAAAFAASGVDPGRRAETLEIAEFAALAAALPDPGAGAARPAASDRAEGGRA